MSGGVHRRPCCATPIDGPHIDGCAFEPTPENGPDYEKLFPGGSPAAREGVQELISFGPPVVDITLDRAMRKGIAQQLRVLANVLDPPS